MIRLIGRRLIIPRGDTGTFSIPLQGAVEGIYQAKLGIYDPLLNQWHEINAANELDDNGNLVFNFTTADTKDLEPSERYQWDIRIFRDEDNDGEYESVDSYYAAFGKSMPKCVIKQVAVNV